MNGKTVHMYVDSGCKKSLIPESVYSLEVGNIQPSAIKLRPYGTSTLLSVEGEVLTKLTSENGATITTSVYVINGRLAEPLLGDADAKALGILSINEKGNFFLAVKRYRR